MTDISRHSLLKQAYDVCQEIEKCGASPQLTSAVTKASDLLRALDAYIPVQSCDPEKFIIPELPQYKCHKVVRAGKIKAFGSGSAESSVSLEGDFDNSCLLLPHDWVKKHQPEIGGYLVAYEDGYLSYSPAAAFEAGYSLIIDKDSEGTVLTQKADGNETLTFKGSNNDNLSTNYPRWHRGGLTTAFKVGQLNYAPDGKCVISPEDPSLASVTVPVEWCETYAPRVGGYMVASTFDTPTGWVYQTPDYFEGNFQRYPD